MDLIAILAEKVYEFGPPEIDIFVTADLLAWQQTEFSLPKSFFSLVFVNLVKINRDQFMKSFRWFLLCPTLRLIKKERTMSTQK